MPLNVLLIIGLMAPLFAKDADPNGFFKDRTWSISAGGKNKIEARSQYLEEPVQRPNRIVAHLICKGQEPVEVLSKRYCGINYLKEVGGKLEVLFLDYDSSSPEGYCTRKRIQRFEIPNCPGAKKGSR